MKMLFLQYGNNTILCFPMLNVKANGMVICPQYKKKNQLTPGKKVSLVVSDHLALFSLGS